MRDSGGAIPHLQLPTWDEITDPDEQMLARACIAWARGKGTMFQGRLIEAHVAVVLGAAYPPTAIHAWDLEYEGIPLQVRSAARTGSFSLAGNDGVEVFVLVVKPCEPSDHSDLEYFVLSSREVAAIGRKSIRVNKLRAIQSPCSRQDLAARIRAARP